MQYLLSVYIDENSPFQEEEMKKAYADVDAFNNELKAIDALVFAGGLRPTSSATTLRPKAGEVLVTDGPFAETKEVLGGFWVIKAADLDAAMALAKKGALACAGTVEVRPFDDEPEA